MHMWTKYANVKVKECDGSSMSYEEEFFDHGLEGGIVNVFGGSHFVNIYYILYKKKKDGYGSI